MDSASENTHARLCQWQLSDRPTIAIFQHPHLTDYITFSIDDRHTLCSDIDTTISERAAPKDALPEEALNTLESMVFFVFSLVPASSHRTFLIPRFKALV
jgi:hypothetical protein